MVWISTTRLHLRPTQIHWWSFQSVYTGPDHFRNCLEILCVAGSAPRANNYLEMADIAMPAETRWEHQKLFSSDLQNLLLIFTLVDFFFLFFSVHFANIGDWYVLLHTIHTSYKKKFACIPHTLFVVCVYSMYVCLDWIKCGWECSERDFLSPSLVCVSYSDIRQYMHEAYLCARLFTCMCVWMLC